MGSRLIPSGWFYLSVLAFLIISALPVQAQGPSRLLCSPPPAEPGLAHLPPLSEALSLGALFQDDGSIDTGEGEAGPGGEPTLGDLLPQRTAMNETVEKIKEHGLYEFWVGGYFWPKPYVLAKGKSTQQDMRAAIAQSIPVTDYGGYVPRVRTVNFKDELGLDNTPHSFFGFVQAEIGVRLTNNCFRLMWWLWEDLQDKQKDRVLVKRHTVFGDKVYEQGHPIRFPFRMMDTKLIYEYRIIPWRRLQVFFGLALHWLYTIDYNAMFDVYEEEGTDDHVSAYINSGTPDFMRKAIAEEESSGHYPLISLSLRIDAQPVEGFHITADIQEMYVYYGNYLDMRIGVWNELAFGFRLGAGYRIWAITANVTELGTHKTNFQGRAVFQGLWIGLFWHFM